MPIKVRRVTKDMSGVRLHHEDAEGTERGRAYVYFLKNELHARPFALLEDVFVEESARGHGVGTALVQEAILTAQERNCYKLIATSRFAREKVHAMYKELGLAEHGIEFRMNYP